MTNYTGRFTLVAEDGAEHEVEGRYATGGSPGELRSWEGSFTGGYALSNLVGGSATLRLPDGREGQVLISNVTMSSEIDGIRGKLVGNGPPPGEAD